MPNPKTLRFRASGTSLVQDLAAMEGGVRRYVGRKFEEVEPGRLGWVPTDEAEEVAFHAFYANACAAGDLEAADEATAQACGVAWQNKTKPQMRAKLAAPKSKGA